MTCPFADLGLPDTATVAEVKVAWRTIAMTLHPDLGGDPVVFDEKRQSYTAALDKALNRPCGTCGGKGKIIEMHGWSSSSVLCPICKMGGAK